jgi:hypothetical protein
MLKRLKLKSLLPSSALRSNSAALRLSKTPPQGGVFVSDASHFPGGGSRLTRATNARRHHSGQPTQTPHLPVAPVSAAPPGNKRCQCHSLGASLRATNPNTALTRSPGKHSATGEQTVPVPQPPGHHSGQPTQTPHLPVAPVSAAPPGTNGASALGGVAPVSAAPPGNKQCQCQCHSLQGIAPGHLQRRATGSASSLPQGIAPCSPEVASAAGQ